MNFETSLINKFLFFLEAERGLAKNTTISYRFDLEDFVEFLISKKLSFEMVNYLTILSYFEFLAKTKEIESSTQLRKISVLSNFYEFLIREEGFAYNPITEFERPKNPETLPIFLEEKEMQYLLTTAREDNSKKGIRDYTILELLYSSGMRISECLTLKVSDILDGKKSIKSSIIIKGKSDKERIIFINNNSKEALKLYLPIRTFFENSQNGYVFNAKSKTGFLSRQNFFYSLKQITRKANLDDDIISPHKIRHSFATHLFLNGIDVRILQEMLGHADISTTQIYTHINQNSLKKVIEKFHPFGDK
jgi:integrase/recombinase XerD